MIKGINSHSPSQSASHSAQDVPPPKTPKVKQTGCLTLSVLGERSNNAYLELECVDLSTQKILVADISNNPKAGIEDAFEYSPTGLSGYDKQVALLMDTDSSQRVGYFRCGNWVKIFLTNALGEYENPLVTCLYPSASGEVEILNGSARVTVENVATADVTPPEIFDDAISLVKQENGHVLMEIAARGTEPCLYIRAGKASADQLEEGTVNLEQEAVTLDLGEVREGEVIQVSYADRSGNESSKLFVYSEKAEQGKVPFEMIEVRPVDLSPKSV